MGKLLLMIAVWSPLTLFAQGQPLRVSGMEFSYALRDDSVDIMISAPTLGWVGVGFNNRNDIVQSDLLLFHVIDGQTEVLDMYVIGAGNPKEDDKIGGQNSVRIKSGKEIVNTTIIQFSISLDSQDPYDYAHALSKDFWLILAYSTHDEFAHHSRVRRHVKYRFENN